MCVAPIFMSKLPSLTERDSSYSKWKEAVKRSLFWEMVPDETPPSFPIATVTLVSGLVFAAAAGGLLYFLRRGGH